MTKYGYFENLLGLGLLVHETYSDPKRYREQSEMEDIRQWLMQDWLSLVSKHRPPNTQNLLAPVGLSILQSICKSYLLLSPVEASSAGFSLSDSCFLSSGLESPFILLSRASVTHTHTRQEQTHTQTHTLSACINNPNKQPSSCPDTHSSSSPFTSPTLKSPGGVRRGMTCDTLMPISGPGGD